MTQSLHRAHFDTNGGIRSIAAVAKCLWDTTSETVYPSSYGLGRLPKSQISTDLMYPNVPTPSDIGLNDSYGLWNAFDVAYSFENPTLS